METEGTLSSAWDQHLASEFAAQSPEQALVTMTAEPYVNVVPLMIGSRGRNETRDFYANHFLSQIPPDMETVPVSRTVGQGRVVDELIMRFTHSIRMDWLLPGIAPTGITRGGADGRHCAVRGRQGRARALLGPGFAACSGRPARPNASCARRRDRCPGAKPHATDERTHPSRVEQ